MAEDRREEVGRRCWPPGPIILSFLQDVVRQSIPVFAAHPLSKQLGTLLGHRVQSSRRAQALAGRGRVRRVLSRASALGTEQTVAAVAGGPGRLDQ